MYQGRPHSNTPVRAVKIAERRGGSLLSPHEPPALILYDTSNGVAAPWEESHETDCDQP